eukprot:GHVQ01013951.1.p1 GENE.GHVQ01013951.1~~GHVQ01013951.1.p1  ORF type:complete len:216 (-),score=26.83 GHVQ01013951.1:98-745(-)
MARSMLFYRHAGCRNVDTSAMLRQFPDFLRRPFGLQQSCWIQTSLLSPAGSVDVFRVGSAARFTMLSHEGRRKFSTKSEEKADEAHEDRSLVGRYGLAVFRASLKKSSLDKVFSDLDMLKSLAVESSEFKLFLESPGINIATKLSVISAIGDRYKLHDITVSFLKVLLENRRLPQLTKTIEAFEENYRKHKGEIKCQVTSAKVTFITGCCLSPAT